MYLTKYLLLILTAFCISTQAHSTTMLDSLVEEALQNNPDIKAAKVRWEAYTMRPSQEGSLPNPMIGGRFTNVGFHELTLGDDPRSDIQAYISQEIPFPGKLSSQEKISQEESESQKWIADATTRNVIADLKVTYFEWAFINKSIEITKKNKELLDKFTKTAESRYEVGMGIQQDVLKAQVELSGFIERLELLNEREEIIETRIKKILNRPLDSLLGEPEETPQSDISHTLAEITESTLNLAPQLKSSAKLIDSRAESLKLARKEYLPDFVVGATYFNRDGGSGNLDDIWQLSLGLKVPLYYWRKEKFGVKEAALNFLEARENHESTKNNVVFQIKDNYIKAATAEKLLELYDTGIIPQSTLSLESAISAYEVGKVDFLTLLNNLVTLFNFELEYHRQLANYNTALARLEEISGMELINQSNI